MLIGQDADCRLAACCDDSRLTERRRLGAEVNEARTAGRALLGGGRGIKMKNSQFSDPYSTAVIISMSFLPVEYL